MVHQQNIKSSLSFTSQVNLSLTEISDPLFLFYFYQFCLQETYQVVREEVQITSTRKKLWNYRCLILIPWLLQPETFQTKINWEKGALDLFIR